MKEINENSINDSLKAYFSRAKKSKDFLADSISVSSQELSESVFSLFKKPNIKGTVQLFSDIIGSSAWIGNSYLNLMLTLSGLIKPKEKLTDPDDHRFIIEKISKNIRIPENQFSEQEIFRSIYNELEYAHQHPDYITPLELPKIFPTIVLISGVFNELYKTAAFERGVKHAAKISNLKYFVAKTDGFEGTAYNSTLIENQLFEYHKEHPDEKLWIISYSKGGIDSLHFLRKNKDWCEKNIVGLSTIASPILGSPHLSNRLFKLVKYFQDLSTTDFLKHVDENKDVLKREFLKSLDHGKQEPWFRANYHLLPENCFYTSIALEAEWYESHLYMMVAKIIFSSENTNDGVVDAANAIFPSYFKAKNLGLINGHHLIGARSSTYAQEALIMTHIIYLKHLNLV
jgi:hypothetical protein